MLEVNAISGEPNIGSDYIDHILVHHCVKSFFASRGVSILKNKGALVKLRNACERAKCDLTAKLKAEIKIQNLADGYDFSLSLSRAEFDSLCAPVLQKCTQAINNALAEAQKEPQEICEIYLTGRSTQIPKLRNLISQRFNGR